MALKRVLDIVIGLTVDQSKNTELQTALASIDDKLDSIKQQGQSAVETLEKFGLTAEEAAEVAKQLGLVEDEAKAVDAAVKDLTDQLVDLGATQEKAAEVAKQLVEVRKEARGVAEQAEQAQNRFEKFSDALSKAGFSDAEIKKLGSQFKLTTSEAEDTARSIQDVSDSLVEMGVEEDNAYILASSFVKARDESIRLEESIEQLDRRANLMNQTFGELEGIGVQIGAAGSVILAPLLLSVNKYVETVGDAEAASIRWRRANEKMSQAQVDAGRKATEALVPYLEILAKITEKLSEVDPRLIQAAIGVGGLMALVGTLGVMTAQIGRMASSIMQLVAGMRALAMNQGANPYLRGAAGFLNTATVAVGAVGVGTAIGVGAVRAYGRHTGDERLANYGLGDAAKTWGQIIFGLSTALNKGTEAVFNVMINFAETLDMLVLDIKDALSDLADNLIKAGSALVGGVLNQEILGKKIGDIIGVSPDEALRAGREADQRIEERRVFRENPGAAAEMGITTKRQEVEEFFQNLRTLTADEFARADKNLAEMAESLGLLDSATEDATEKTEKMREEALIPLVQEFEQTMKDLDKAEKELNANITDAKDKFAEDQEKAETEHNEERLKQVQDFEEQRLQLEEDYYDQREQKVDDFNAGQKEARSDFYANQSQASAEFYEGQQQSQEDFIREQSEAQEDFYDELQKMDRDYHDNIRKAARSLDAQAIFDLQENYKKERSEKVDQYTDQRDETQEQHDRQLRLDRERFEKQQAQAEDQFNLSQERERQKFDESLRREDEQFAEAQKRTAEQFQKTLEEQDEQFAKEREEAQKNFDESIKQQREELVKQREEARQHYKDSYDQLVAYHTAEANALQAHYDLLKAQLLAFINGTPVPSAGSSGATITPFQEGGYSGSGGNAMLHPNEFVMDARTTGLFERSLGRLNQESLQQFIKSIGNIGVNQTFNGSYDEGRMERIAIGALRKAIREI